MKHTADRLVWVTPITFFLTTRSLHLEGICVKTHWSSFPPLPMFPNQMMDKKLMKVLSIMGHVIPLTHSSFTTNTYNLYVDIDEWELVKWKARLWQEVKDFFSPFKTRLQKMNVLLVKNTNDVEGVVKEDLDQFINPRWS